MKRGEKKLVGRVLKNGGEPRDLKPTPLSKPLQRNVSKSSRSGFNHMLAGHCGQ